MSSITNEIKKFFGFIEEEDNESRKNESFNLAAPSTPKKSSFKGNIISSKKSFNYSEIKVSEPRVYEDSINIASYLRESKPVIVNLKFLDADAGKRLIDFICGTAYAINGHMLKIGENIFLFTPSSVLISNSEDQTQLEKGIEDTDKEIFFQKSSLMSF